MARQRNDGLRKRCTCARRTWAKCPHPWHFSFKWNGEHYRFSLDRHIGRIVRGADGTWERDRTALGDRITDKTKAEGERDRLKTAIREGTLQQPAAAARQCDTLTLAQLMDAYRKQYISVHRAGTLTNTTSQIRKIERTVLDRPDGTARAFGEWLVLDVTTDTIEEFRQVRMRTAPIGANRDLALLRALFNWATSNRRKLATDNPFLDGSRAAVKLTRETKRSRRLHPGEGERLLAACSPHLRPIVEAALETGCRLGELLSLQWWQVRFTPKAELFLPAKKTKTKTDRTIPISTRLRLILDMRRTDPAGHEHPSHAYVFGNECGERVKRVSRAWERAVLVAHGYTPAYTDTGTRGLTAECRATLRTINLHFHDLRREAGSRWLDGGVPLHRIKQWLGHANIAQTSTYLEAAAADNHDEMQRYESRQAKATEGSIEGTRAPYPPRVQPCATDSETGAQTGVLGDMTATEIPNKNTPRHH